MQKAIINLWHCAARQCTYGVSTKSSISNFTFRHEPACGILYNYVFYLSKDRALDSYGVTTVQYFTSGMMFLCIRGNM